LLVCQKSYKIVVVSWDVRNKAPVISCFFVVPRSFLAQCSFYHINPWWVGLTYDFFFICIVDSINQRRSFFLLTLTLDSLSLDSLTIPKIKVKPKQEGCTITTHSLLIIIGTSIFYFYFVLAHSCLLLLAASVLCVLLCSHTFVNRYVRCFGF